MTYVPSSTSTFSALSTLERRGRPLPLFTGLPIMDRGLIFLPAPVPVLDGVEAVTWTSKVSPPDSPSPFDSLFLRTLNVQPSAIVLALLWVTFFLGLPRGRFGVTGVGLGASGLDVVSLGMVVATLCCLGDLLPRLRGIINDECCSDSGWGFESDI
jgi:hypothetical protein